VIADAQPRRSIFVFEILGRVTDDAARMKLIVRADGRQASQIDMRSDDAMRADDYILVDHGVRSDCDSRIQLRSRMHNGTAVDHGAASSHADTALSQQR
jgi:hypothetical protein